jgi:putative toxin-antitoxin system antitoxin component (TIGR02293 family)
MRESAMPQNDSVAHILGIRQTRRPITTLEMIDRIQDGLPVAALYRVSEVVAPGDANFKFQIVSRATLARRRNRPSARLTADESDRLARLAKVWSCATRVWRGDEGARAFLFRPHPLLARRTPIELALTTDLGARLVEDILGRLEHGSAP